MRRSVLDSNTTVVPALAGTRSVTAEPEMLVLSGDEELLPPVEVSSEKELSIPVQFKAVTEKKYVGPSGRSLITMLFEDARYTRSYSRELVPT